MYFSISVPQRPPVGGGLERPSLLRTVTPFGVPAFRPAYWLCQTLGLQVRFARPPVGGGPYAAPLHPLLPPPHGEQTDSSFLPHGKYKKRR